MGEGVVFKRQVFIYIQTFVVLCPQFHTKKDYIFCQLNHFTFTILLKAIYQVLLFYISHKN